MFSFLGGGSKSTVHSSSHFEHNTPYGGATFTMDLIGDQVYHK